MIKGRFYSLTNPIAEYWFLLYFGFYDLAEYLLLKNGRIMRDKEEKTILEVVESFGSQMSSSHRKDQKDKVSLISIFE